MALQVIWTPLAKEQLDDILAYWVERNGTSTYSKKLYEIIKSTLTRLVIYPQSGNHTDNPIVRVKIVKNYFMFYSFNETYLYVTGFCDMRRDPEYIDSLIYL